MIDVWLFIGAVVIVIVTVYACLQANNDGQSDSRLRLGAAIFFVIVVAMIARMANGN